jgi:hypothetical protein
MLSAFSTLNREAAGYIPLQRWCSSAKLHEVTPEETVPSLSWFSDLKSYKYVATSRGNTKFLCANLFQGWPARQTGELREPQFRKQLRQEPCSNPLKTKRICFIQGLSAYRAVNTLHIGYINQSLNV